MEGDQSAQHGRIMRRHNGFIADNPRIKLRIGDFDQTFELVMPPRTIPALISVSYRGSCRKT